MAFAPNHSNNLPREFCPCPRCSKKGLYRYGGTAYRTMDGYTLDGVPPGRRCKYCGHRIHDLTPDEYRRQLNRHPGD